MENHGYVGSKILNTRQLADRFRQLAEYLDDKPVFTLDNCVLIGLYDGKMATTFDSKEHFVNAVKAIGDGVKHTTEGEYAKFVVSAKWAPINLEIYRDKVCKRTVTYDCKPLFSAEEVEAL